MKFIQEYKGATIEAIVYPLLIVALMWSVFLIDRSTEYEFYKFGILPQSFLGIKGILLMPFIHSQKDFSHIINNSIPTLILLSTLIYFYRQIAFWVLFIIWIFSGVLLWLFAENTGSYHIGMSAVIYGLFGFLFVSGFFRKYLPLQAISLFVVFIYGSLVWGIFPFEQGVSWEGHLFGFSVGIIMAFAFRKHGPVVPKYGYEIEKELGIEPPDLEGIWNENRRIFQEQENFNNQDKIQINYEYKPNSIPEEKNNQ